MTGGTGVERLRARLRIACAPIAWWLAATLASAPAPAQAPTGPKDAEPATRAAHEAITKTLPLADQGDFEDATFGFVATLPDAHIAGDGPRAWPREQLA